MAYSRNHSCSGNARMDFVFLFPTLSNKHHDFSKVLLKIKCVF